jgi:hypothetical protein
MQTVGQIIAGIYMLLQYPEETELPYPSVKQAVDDIALNMVTDENVRGRAGRVVVSEDIAINRDAIDYTIDVPNAIDFEPLRLERATNAGGGYAAWEEVVIVPFEAWEAHYDQNYVAATFYGGREDGIRRLKLNLDADDFGQSLWRLSYKTPLVVAAQEGSNPAIRQADIPLLKYAAAVLLIPQVQRHDKEWMEWVKLALPIYGEAVTDGRRRFREYLDHSPEPKTAPLPRADAHRIPRYRRNKRAYLPIGSS